MQEKFNYAPPCVGGDRDSSINRQVEGDGVISTYIPEGGQPTLIPRQCFTQGMLLIKYQIPANSQVHYLQPIISLCLFDLQIK